MTTLRLGVVTAILAMGLATAAAAQPPGGAMRHPMPGGQMGHGPGMGSMEEHARQVMEQLNLTDAQKQQVHQLMTGFMSKNHETMAQMEKLHQQLRDQVFADSGPTGDTSAIAKQINDLQAGMLQSQIELHEQISKILDPAQRKKMREMPMPGMMGGGPPPEK